MRRHYCLGLIIALLSVGMARAQSCATYPNTLTNGTTADATQVMANFNYVLHCSVQRGFLGGATLSNDATSPNTVMDTAAGLATSDDATVQMPIAAFTKNANAAWAVGSAGGCLDSGSALAASTWYHLFIIERTDTAVVDELCSTSATLPTLPSSYSKKRRIGSFRTDTSAHILGFLQVGDQFMWKTSILDVNAAAPGSAAVTRTLTVPAGVVTEALVEAGVQAAATSEAVLLSPLAITDSPALLGSFASVSIVTGGGGSGSVGVTQARVLTNTSSQIRSRMWTGGTGSATFITTIGWRDFLGR